MKTWPETSTVLSTTITGAWVGHIVPSTTTARRWPASSLARDNGFGVRGVAPRATVYGYNWLAGDWQQFEDINRADAMSRNRVVTAVSNNSWGPRDGPWLGYANHLWKSAVDSGTREGYDGKGVFYAWAGGNGGRRPS